jgi:hypothetical protein
MKQNCEILWYPLFPFDYDYVLHIVNFTILYFKFIGIYQVDIIVKIVIIDW